MDGRPVRQLAVTRRIYGGFAMQANRGEPLSYEEGHGLNAWLFDFPAVDGVWYGWGPYIWAPDCASGETNGRGYCYALADYENDGVHPAPPARQKVAEMMHARFGEHLWYQP